MAVLENCFDEVGRYIAEFWEREATDVPLDKLTGFLLKSLLELHRRFPSFWRLLSWSNLEQTTPAIWPGYHRQDTDIVRDKFVQAQEQGYIDNKLSFDAYWFSIISITYFYHSNHYTMSSTQGNPEMYTSEWEDRLVGDLNRVFTASGTKN